MSSEYGRALDAARHFISIGLVPLPSRMDDKRPMLKEYKDYRTKKVPDHIYFGTNWKTTNIQVMTGVETTGSVKVMVVDLDGPEAKAAWAKICADPKTGNGFSIRGGARQWVSNTGSGGMHIWFRVPEGASRCPSRMLWGLYDTLTGWVKHREIRVLGDGGLAVAPPSVRVDGAGCYSWHAFYNPHTIDLPDVAPAWLFDMPGVITPERKYYNQPDPKNVQRPHGDDLRSKVLAALGPNEKFLLVKSWGLRFDSEHPRIARGWMPVRALDSEDKTPSAGWDASTGVYHEFKGEGRSLSLFDLSVALGAYRSWKEAADNLAQKYSITR